MSKTIFKSGMVNQFRSIGQLGGNVNSFCREYNCKLNNFQKNALYVHIINSGYST